MPRYYGQVKAPHSEIVDLNALPPTRVEQGPHVLLGFALGEVVPIVLERHRHVNEVAQDITIKLECGAKIIMTGVWTTARHQVLGYGEGYRIFECYVTQQRDQSADE